MIAAIIGIILIAVITMEPVMSNVETPNYEVVKSEGDTQIRKYAQAWFEQIAPLNSISLLFKKTPCKLPKAKKII